MQCLWFKRVFTNLYAVNKKDPARHVYLDTVWDTGELDSDAQKSLNHLKETRMTAKYIGLALYLCIQEISMLPYVLRN